MNANFALSLLDMHAMYLQHPQLDSLARDPLLHVIHFSVHLLLLLKQKCRNAEMQKTYV